MRKLLYTVYNVYHSKLPPKPSGESEKKALFSNFLLFFTFARETKKITFFFCKKSVMRETSVSLPNQKIRQKAKSENFSLYLLVSHRTDLVLFRFAI